MAKPNRARKENNEEAAPLRVIRSLSASDSGVDPIIHARARLAIMSALAVNDSLSFAELKSIVATTDGNLSVHARKLEEAGYLICRKTFEGRTPRTNYRLSAAGRRALARYLDHMEALVDAMRSEGD